MAKRVIWSPLAIRRRREILEYWIMHNKSKAYSRKLNSVFKGAQKLISQHPDIGIPTDDQKLDINLCVITPYFTNYEKIRL
jgi:plasmid stabilization system protein ParE